LIPVKNKFWTSRARTRRNWKKYQLPKRKNQNRKLNWWSRNFQNCRLVIAPAVI